jgi:hypothetical protein
VYDGGKFGEGNNTRQTAHKHKNIVIQRLQGQVSVSGRKKDIFLFSTASKSALKATENPVQTSTLSYALMELCLIN